MMRRLTALLVTVVLALQATSCGFLLYPERKGQKSGQIDPGVAILDAAGLLVFIVPGLVAFGVDFVTGCIYMPGGKRAASHGEPLQVAYLDPKTMNEQSIENVVRQATGVSVDLASPAVQAVAVSDAEALQAQVIAAL
jgi:hypothetical protein